MYFFLEDFSASRLKHTCMASDEAQGQAKHALIILTSARTMTVGGSSRF